MYKTILLFLLLIGFGNPLYAAPESELWPRWQTHAADSTARIDHRGWSAVLRGYLFKSEDGIHRFDYANVSDADHEKLDRYLEQMAKTKISEFNRDVQRAYWINIYNALTVREILRFYPVASIRDISSGLFSFGPWKKDVIEIEGEEISLNDIEHRILRPIWQDPRIHYALNCASLGCPDLQLRVFTGGNTDATLDRAAREFINHPRGAEVVDGKLQVSSLYVWFVDDFGGNDTGVIAHLQQYAYSTLANALKNINEIDNDDYDWSLNSLDDVSNAKRVRNRGGS
jgi:hypothetical protein